MSEFADGIEGKTQNSETVVVTSISSIDLQKLAEKVYQLLLRELVIENERSGRRN